MRQDELAGNETFGRLVDGERRVQGTPRVKIEGGVMNAGIDLGVAIPIAVGRDMAIDSCQKVKTAMGGRPMTMRDQR